MPVPSSGQKRQLDQNSPVSIKRAKVPKNSEDVTKGKVSKKDPDGHPLFPFKIGETPVGVKATWTASESLPTRNEHGELVFKSHPKFRPNLTPKQVMQMGSFGGTYFRTIKSSVTGKLYKKAHKEFPSHWFEGLNIDQQVTSRVYNTSVNKFGVSCGLGLADWEEKGWITKWDPYGWFMWYCRFYLGRRCEDDERQISRGQGVMSNKGRFRNQLYGKIVQKNTTFDDESVSPVIRQTLQHWGYQCTQRDLEKYCKEKGYSVPGRSE